MQQPPSDRGKRLKIFYMTQVSVKPPTFVIFYFLSDCSLIQCPALPPLPYDTYTCLNALYVLPMPSAKSVYVSPSSRLLFSLEHSSVSPAVAGKGNGA